MQWLQRIKRNNGAIIQSGSMNSSAISKGFKVLKSGQNGEGNTLTEPIGILTIDGARSEQHFVILKYI